jgi:hypothetical protein
LLYFKRYNRSYYGTCTEDDVLTFTRGVFDTYCRSDDYAEDNAAAGTLATAGLKAPPGSGGGSGSAGTAVVAGAGRPMTAQEFRCGVKWDKAHYGDLKDGKYFNSWNRGFVATARMHHTHLVLDEKYVPKDDVAKAAFKEMKIFMYAVLEDHFKTDKGKSLVSKFEQEHDAQCIYCELKNHALASTATQLSGDRLLQYIAATRYPGDWRGTSFAFLLHWREQIMKYEKLELEDSPPKQ